MPLPRLTQSPPTVRIRLGMLRVFFQRIIERGWDDSPARCPVFVSDLPTVDDPLPKFLDEHLGGTVHAGRRQPDPVPRLIVAFGRPRERF